MKLLGSNTLVIVLFVLNFVGGSKLETFIIGTTCTEDSFVSQRI